MSHLQRSPQEETRTTAFRAVVDYIEEHDEEKQITIMDFVSKMDECLADTGLPAYIHEETPFGAF